MDDSSEWVRIGTAAERAGMSVKTVRFYSPGSYAKLPGRTDWGGEIELEYPISKNAVVFAHWEPIYSTKGGEGWGKGFQHHVGTGVSFSF